MKRFVGLLQMLRALAMLALLAMMLVTIVDVTMRLALNRLLLGSVELVQWTLVAVVFLALPETFYARQHITVDVVDQWVSARALGRLRRLAAVATALLLIVMAWRMIRPAFDTLEIGDLTSDLQISLFWYWLPIVIGSLTAAIVAAILAVRAFRSAGGGED